MFATLAQAGGNAPLDNLFQTVTSIFSRADSLAHPAEMLKALHTLSVVWAVVFLIVGLLCLFNGYKFHRAVTIAMAAFIGLFAGYMLSQSMNIKAPYVVAGCLGVLLAVVAWPLMKYAVAVIGGLSGAFLGANIWTSIALLSDHPDAAQHHWVGAFMGLVIFGMLAFVVFNLSVMLLTSISGATFAVLGALALLLNIEGLRPSMQSSLSAHGVIIPMLVVVPAVIGLILQQTWLKAEGGPKPAAKPAGK
jgi:hypothetical protein